ncbi:MAG: AsmA family protein, partial [Alistipes sp.]|nr:AsmA family protein [Alistipes sp.]
MLKKILKYTFRTLLVFLLVLMLIPALLYIPAVQDFVRGKAVAYASRTLGMDLSVERIRLSFPLRLSVNNTLLSDEGDTLLSCERLSLDVALWPLVRKEVSVRSLELTRLAAHYKDSTAGMDLKIAAGQFSLDGCRVGLSAKTVGISRIALTDGDVFLNTGESAPVEKADSSAALPWQIDVGKLTVANLAFGMRTTPAVTELSVRLPDGEIDSCRVLLDDRQVSVKSILLNRGGYAYLTAPTDAGEKVADKTTVPEKTASPSKTAAPDKTVGADKTMEPAKTASPDSETSSLPWTVRVGSVALNDNSMEYGVFHHRPAEGLDPAYIALSSLNLSVDSIYNRGADVALRIRRLAFTAVSYTQL